MERWWHHHHQAREKACCLKLTSGGTPIPTAKRRKKGGQEEGHDLWPCAFWGAPPQHKTPLVHRCQVLAAAVHGGSIILSLNIWGGGGEKLLVIQGEDCKQFPPFSPIPSNCNKAKWGWMGSFCQRIQVELDQIRLSEF